MGKKDDFVSILKEPSGTILQGGRVFPYLDVPILPTNPQEYIRCCALSQRELVRWLSESFGGIAISDYIGSFGVKNNAVVASVLSSLRDNKATPAGIDVADYVYVEGDVDGEGCYSQAESLIEREENVASLQLIEKALALFPDVGEISALQHIVNYALSIASVAGSLAANLVGGLLGLCVEIVIRYLIDRYIEKPLHGFEGDMEVVCQRLTEIKEQLVTIGGGLKGSNPYSSQNALNEIGSTLLGMSSGVDGIRRVIKRDYAYEEPGSPPINTSVVEQLQRIKGRLDDIALNDDVLAIGEDAIYLKSKTVVNGRL